MVGILQRIAMLSVPSVAAVVWWRLNGCHLQNRRAAEGDRSRWKYSLIRSFAHALIDWCYVNGFRLLFFFAFFMKTKKKRNKGFYVEFKTKSRFFFFFFSFRLGLRAFSNGWKVYNVQLFPLFMVFFLNRWGFGRWIFIAPCVWFLHNIDFTFCPLPAFHFFIV